ncbi:hypothetical protein OsJ_14518 [Oryza sativa Japonica Group]|uniref:Uncharacterized protein n=1 Tax=Oryza sativa subsp. japonica TaxID=39947 RepID=B9FET6_ORYSJ|nr:hypothetical protein OsJ_14518 [Oryza sativa Japonica Group]
MEMESPRSPEAEIGHRVEDLWEVAEPQLSPSEKLNSCFEDITVASFHRPLGSQDMCLLTSDFALMIPRYVLERLAGIHGDIYASPRDHICASLHNWALPIADPLFKTRSYNKDMIWWSTEGTIIQCCLQTVLFFTPGVWLDII